MTGFDWVKRNGGPILAIYPQVATCKHSGVKKVKPMTSTLTYPIRFWAIVLTALLIYQFSTNASADSCRYEKEINETLNLAKSDLLTISAGAGDLDVIGVPGTGEAVIRARVCASKQDWLEESNVITTPGKLAEITTSLPNSDGSWMSLGNSYVWMDLAIEVPESLAVEVKDSSGDMSLKNVAVVQIKDSSGDIEVVKARDSITINDSSGDIEIDGANGDLTIESDSSGDIEVTDIHGTVLVMQDSSGDIEATDISDNFVVERDSSGDISANDIGGDFRVLKDGSGSIKSRDVQGEIDIPSKD
jgi:hypothetical protein